MADINDPLMYLIRKDNASTLGITGERLQRALDALRTYEAQHKDRGAAYQALEKTASERLFAYIVQREACGLYLHDGILKEYEVPPRVYARMGVTG